MKTFRLDPTILGDLSWWHWAVTIPLLATFILTGQPWAIAAAIGLCAMMLIAYETHFNSWRPFPVQIRAGFLILLVMGLIPGVWWMHYSQLAGVSIMVLFGYCPLHRMLLLMPWNRNQPLTIDFAMQAFLRAPGNGGVFCYQGPAEPLPAACAVRGVVATTD